MTTSKKNKRRQHAIVIDYDDTVVDFLGFVSRLHNHLHGTCITQDDLKKWNFEGLDFTDAMGNRVTGDDVRETFLKYENVGLYASLPAIKDSRSGLNLIQKLGYKIIIVTARDEKFQDQTLLNMFHQKIPYDEIYFTDDKVKKIRELSEQYIIDLFADDRAATVQSVAEKTHVPLVFLIDKAHNRDFDDPDIIRISTLFECVRYLKDIS